MLKECFCCCLVSMMIGAVVGGTLVVSNSKIEKTFQKGKEMVTEKIEELRFFFQIWTLGFANAIDRQRMYHENRDLLEMRLQYNRDELTGIGNRREIEKILRNRHQRFRTYGEGFCVVSIDMDGLKIINDTYGHLEGDIALKAMAEILDK